MGINPDFISLTGTFRMLGVPDPEQYAESEIEGAPLLAMVVLLKHMAACLVQVGDPNWHLLASSVSDSAPVQESLKRVCNAGLDQNDLIRVIRTIQVRLLHDVCTILDGLAYKRCSHAELEARTCHTAWGLFTVGNRRDARLGRSGQPQAWMGGLHEVVFDVIPE